MAFFSTITQFATPRDVTLQQLKIECFFPADYATEQLSRRLGTRVEVRDRKGKGELVISYGSLDELDRLLECIK